MLSHEEGILTLTFGMSEINNKIFYVQKIRTNKKNSIKLNKKMQNETLIYYNILAKPVINISDLRLKVFRSGIPNNNKLRSKIWKLLLKYYPPEQHEWVATDAKYLSLYRKYKKIYLHIDSPVISEETKEEKPEGDNVETN